MTAVKAGRVFVVTMAVAGALFLMCFAAARWVNDGLAAFIMVLTGCLVLFSLFYSDRSFR